MRAISVSGVSSVAVRSWIATSLALVLAFSALSIVYFVGLEPMLYLHDAFHDIRHSTGFPCH
ncbi:CbtB-domain containing protein [Leptospira langatensis]|uniref:CbtB-domain containing protein n=2 Tax=Leptospira langatensis TaxID=2484983 RepID=A0A5F1ZXF3_9LEPT|nr:CbtB-domain containing protein [Leptospira langatensis]TGJ98439.1 CbtB-domain containing protein [Leptospira langatensis]TGL43354.1 CbtB-domain containing protein [Leptospira langatensis]